MRIIKKIKAFFCIYLIFYSSIAHGQNPNALPTNPNITNGSAVISQSGSSLTINQSTEKLITNWSTFNIGSNASVEFVQPSSSSSALNRVSSNDPTHIYGNLKANGKIILMNPSGVLFHNGSRVDVGALIATSLNMQDGDFLNNQYIFEKDGIAGTVNNKGIINAFENGAVALIAPSVKNEGTINTPSGTTALLSGDKVTLTLNGNKLIQYSIDTGTLNSLVENKHAINAGDGVIILSAKGLENISQSVVQNSGTLKAEGITNKGGKIYLSAREGQAVNTGTISVNSQNNQGGEIEITADDIEIKSGSTLSAKGATGGGKIQVGGSWQNSDTNVYQATTTTVETDTLIDASATDNGDGGEVVIWSDIYDSNSITKAQGTIYAKAGPNGGDGGRIETSGYKLITDGVSGSASSNLGVAGLWLFDPTNIEIGSSGSSADGTDDGSDLTASSINSLLNSGTSVTVTTQSSSSELGDLTVSSEINKSSGASDVTLTLRAANLIRINDEIKHTGGTGVLNIILDSDNNTSASTAGSSPSRDGGGIIIMEDNISSGGGDITFGGTTSGGFTGGDLYIGGSSTALSIDSGGGDIDIKGQVLISNTNASGVTISSSNGSVTIGGSVDSANTYRFVDDSEITATSSATEWINASADAVLKGGYLVSITSRIENQLAAAATISGGSYRGAWIGAWRDKDNTKGGGATYWYYDDNSPEANTAFLNQGTGPINSAYNNFGSGEPNGTGTGGEWAGQFFGDQANWNDLVGTRDYSQNMDSVYNVMGYVMETNVNPTKLTINAGTGDVTLSGAVGSNKVLSDFTITGAQVTGSSVALNNSTDLNITNSGTSSLTGVISGTSVDLIKNGSGVLTLSGNNTYTGSTSINAGTLKITHAAGLGTTASGTTVASGATLEVSGGLTVAETLSLSGTGASSNGALRFTSGNNTYSGNITLGAHSSVNATAGNNIISGTVNGAYNFVVVSTAGSFTQSGIAGGSTALTAYEVNSSTYNTTISAAVTTNGNINIEAGSIDITANLTATSGNIVLDADTGSAISSGDDGINIGDITIRTNTSGNITLTGRSGSGNVAGLIGVQASGGSTTINSAGNLSVTGISESTNTSATRGIWLKGDYDATGDITLAGQAKSSNDYDVSVQDSTFDAGGNITFDAQNGGRINFAGTNTLTATGNHVYKGDNFVPNSATFNGSGSFSLTPDTDSTAFSTGIDISSASFGTSLTDFTVGVSTNNADVTLGDIDVDGEINVFGGDITLTASNTLTAGSNENIVLSAESNFVNNSGSSALNVSGTGRWIVYAADDDNSTFGNLNSNNAPIWNQQYSSLAPASVSSGNRYVFQESSPSQNITFTTTDETITYGDSADLSDNYSITSSGVSGLANVYAAVPSGGSVSISDAFSANPTITSAGTSAGSHNIRVASGDEGTANSGYSISYANSGTLTVNRRAITVTADDQSKQYGNANPSLTQTVTTGSLVGSDTLSGSVTTAAATGSNVGSYSITQGTLTNANNSNYDITFVNGSLTVSRRDITLTADDKTKTYGDNNPSLTYTVSTGSLYSSDTLSGSITTSATSSTGAGSVSITQGTLTNANNSNYDITFNSGTLTINRKALSITGDNQSRTYGASNPSLTYTLTSGSLVGSDSLSGTLATTATTSTNVGNVNITQGTLTNANNTNYSISYSTGTLSITKASPTISGLSNQSKTTDDSSFTLAGMPSISGPSISYTSSDTDVATVNSSTGEVSILATGTSTITASFTGNSNWNAGSGTYLLTVTEPTISSPSPSEQVVESSSSSTQVADNAAQDVTTAVRQNVRRNSNVVLPGSNTNTFTRPTLISYGNVRAPSPSVSPITTTPSTSVAPSVSTPSQSSTTLVAPTPSQSSSTLVAPTPSQTSNVPRGATNNQSTSLPNASSNQTPASTSATSTGTTTLSSSNVQITSFTAQVDGSVTVRKSTVTANTNVETEGLIPSAQVVVLRPNQDAKVENSFEVKVNSSEAQLKPLSNTSQDYFKPGKLIGSTKFVVELENGLVFNYTIDVQEGGVVIKPADNQSIQFAESNKQVVIGSGILEAVNALGVSPDNMKTIFLDYKS